MRNLVLCLSFCLLACDNPLKESASGQSGNESKITVPHKKAVNELPDELNEISGITFLNDSVLVAIQDEQGILFYYNLKQGKIIKTQVFADEEDYEDLVRADEDMYVVTSKGTLIEISNFQSLKPEIASYITPFNRKNDIEGLAYDKKNNRLLIGPKEYGLTNDKRSKHIYAFDLNTKTFINEPAYTIKLPEIENQFHGDALEEGSKKFLKALGNHNMNKVFRTSALTVHEQTNDLYVLSSINGLIAVLSPEGQMKKIISFAGPEFIQPEGISFAPNGKLYVSNEGGKSGKGNIIEITHEE